MSTERGQPARGPAGTPQPESSSSLLPLIHDARDSKASGPFSSQVTQEDHCQPIRNQPQITRGQNGVCPPVDLDAIHPGATDVGPTCKCSRANGSGATGGPTSGPRAAVAAPTAREPSTPVSHRMQRKLKSSLSVNSDSKGSSAKAPLPEDCCVHCILACLFCEFLTLCNLVVAPAWCGASESCGGCCCCCAEDEGCNCDMDCGIMDVCCESSDCLEICMECCGICFPS